MLERILRIVRNLPARQIFDAEFYLSKNPDLAAARAHPLRHYLEFGIAEGRKPHPLFDPGYYLRRNRSAHIAGSPILHFLRTGGRAGMSPHPLFDSPAYVAAVPEAQGLNPLLHFLKSRGVTPAVTEGSQFGCVS